MSDPYLEELTRRNKELAAAQEESGKPEPVAWRYKLVGTDEWCDATTLEDYIKNHSHVSEVQPLYLGAPAATPEVTEDMVKRAVEAWKGERYYLGTDDSMKRLARAVLRAALEGGEKP